MTDTVFPTDLETIALLTFKRDPETGRLVAAWPNGFGYFEIDGDAVRSFEFVEKGVYENVNSWVLNKVA